MKIFLFLIVLMASFTNINAECFPEDNCYHSSTQIDNNTTIEDYNTDNVGIQNNSIQNSTGNIEIQDIDLENSVIGCSGAIIGTSNGIELSNIDNSSPIVGNVGVVHGTIDDNEIGDSSNLGLHTDSNIQITIIKKHRYKKINTILQIEELKNIKTYLLLPLNISFTYTKSKIYKRYKRALDLVQRLPKYDNNISETEAKKINQFILLAKEKTLEDEPITPKNYNYKLSNQIISIIENNSTLSFKGEGPFLVTTMENIITDENITYLSVDLSPFDNSAINEIVNSYKEHLEEKGMDDFTFLEKLKSKVLSIVVKANENIRTVQMAVAGEL